MTEAIALEDVRFRRADLDVLTGLSLRIDVGEIVVLVGPSGSGKTTVLRVILGLLAPHHGVVRLAGEVVSESGRAVVPPERRDLAVVFQDLALWPHLTVQQNLGFGLEMRRTSRSERENQIRAMLQRVGLADKARRLPGQLSGGEQQRVAIARALVLRPRAVLLDEPLTNLDVVLRAELLGLLRVLLVESGVTALYVTHDVREAVALRARMVVLENGRIVADGAPGALAQKPATPFVSALFAEGTFGAHASSPGGE